MSIDIKDKVVSSSEMMFRLIRNLEMIARVRKNEIKQVNLRRQVLRLHCFIDLFQSLFLFLESIVYPKLVCIFSECVYVYCFQLFNVSLLTVFKVLR